MKDLKINETHFAQDLLLKLKAIGAISEEEYENFTVSIFDILQKEVEHYTAGKSSSIQVHIGEKILLSIYYILGLSLKTIDYSYEAAEYLHNNSMADIYVEGKNILDKLLIESKRLLALVKNSKLNISNYSYNDTIDEGIGTFFNNYNDKFFAHETPAMIDYQLGAFSMDTDGVEYIHGYLESLLFENYFCNYYNIDSVNNILDSIEDSDHLLLNVFQIVLNNAIACKLLEKPNKSIELSSEDIDMLTNLFCSQEEMDISKVIYNTSIEIIEEHNIQDEKWMKYIFLSLQKEMSHIVNNILNGKLDKAFIVTTEKPSHSSSFIPKDRMSDAKLRDLLNEITSCSNVKDKINILKYDVDSIYDLIDILESDAIDDNEYYTVFSSFTKEILALIYNYGINNIDIEEVDTFNWRKFYMSYIESIEEDEMNKIIELSKMLR